MAQKCVVEGQKVVQYYLSQDPIGLLGNNPTFYGYVYDSNTQIDALGLSCTKKLRKNINKAQRDLRKKGLMRRGWRKEKGSAAHHIVAGDDLRAQPARDILKRHGIDIDGADNGIYLKHIDPNSSQPGAYHRVIHTDRYYGNINQRITDADALGGKQGVLDELSSISDDLLFNNKIW
ncbi:AHH domain-containing protein [Flavobacterium davisii]|uniref:AHH domain-containing protein n=2 Tax=Flavobacterium davisii TaxID=2906077 RepID=UPI0035D064C6